MNRNYARSIRDALRAAIGACVLALFSITSHASFPPVVTGYSINCQGNRTAATVDELRMVCAAEWQAYFRALGYTSCTIVGGGTGVWVTTSTSNCGENGRYNIPAAIISACSANSTGTTSCTCNAGYAEWSSSCVPPLEQKSAGPPHDTNCSNPVNGATGNKYQLEVDYVVGPAKSRQPA